MCDIRIASQRAKLGSTFAAVGLIPGDGGAYLLTRTVGFSRAVELILTARLVENEEAALQHISDHAMRQIHTVLSECNVAGNPWHVEAPTAHNLMGAKCEG